MSTTPTADGPGEPSELSEPSGPGTPDGPGAPGEPGQPDGPDELDRLYAYAAWMLGDRAAALAVLRGALADGDASGRLATLRAAVLARAGTPRETPARKRALLDTKLRMGTSVSMKMGHPALRGEARRLQVLLTGFMQSCLIAAVGALQPALRELFVLLVVLELPEAEVLALMGTPTRGLSGPKSRMLSELDAYLGPRCGHLHAANPCHCPNRLLLALEQDFVQLPEHELASERYPSGVFTEVRRMYAALPPLRLTAPVRAALGGVKTAG